MLRVAQVIELTGLSRSTIYAMVKRGEFPANHSIGSRAVAWREAEVLQWLRDRGIPVEREAPKAPAEPAPKQSGRGVRPRPMDEVVAKLPVRPRGSKRRR